MRSGTHQLDPSRLPTCCAELAGTLAEHAITLLTLDSPGAPPRSLRARQTDLPGELELAIPCTLRAETPANLELHLTATIIRWSTNNNALADALARELP
ncbi:MAG: hypothetical protein KF912_13860 [Phycisphaeraceae bacterium]|nr:hypothetical protein [Phycisphaeraceae bacterium]